MRVGAKIQKRDFTDHLELSRILLSVKSFSWNDVGGPESASLEAAGDTESLFGLLNWLRSPILIFDSTLELCWWGRSHTVTVSTGGVEISLSLDTMKNRIAVAYELIQPGEEAAGTRETTEWEQDDDSVDIFGAKEYLASLSNATPYQAEAKRSNLLAASKWPIAIPKQAMGGNPRASIECRGWYDTLDWRYYDQPAGLEGYMDAGDASHKLGLGLTSSEIMFEASAKLISHIGGKLSNFEKDDKIVISGSASNNGIFTVAYGTSTAPWEYTASTLSFVAGTKRIQDSAKGLKPVDAHDLIRIAGSAHNDGYYRVVSAAYDGSWVEVAQTLTDESAGASVTVYRGHAIEVSETLVDEMPGSSVFIRNMGTNIAQSWSLAAAVTWLASTVQVRVRKEGAPTDTLLVRVCADNGGVPSWTPLAEGTIDPDEMSDTTPQWETAVLDTELSITYGVTYHVLLARSGDNDPDNYYVIELNEDLGYPRGTFKLYNGTTWVARSPDADMPFKVCGVMETTEQIALAVSLIGQFLTGTEIVDASGLETSQYRDGDITGLEVINDLLKSGKVVLAGLSGRLLATVTADRILKVYQEPELDEDAVNLFMDAKGSLLDRYDREMPPSQNPVGQWCKLKGEVIPPSVDLSEMSDPSCFFIDQAQFDVGEQKWKITKTRGGQSAWNLGDEL